MQLEPRKLVGRVLSQNKTPKPSLETIHTYILPWDRSYTPDIFYILLKYEATPTCLHIFFRASAGGEAELVAAVAVREPKDHTENKFRESAGVRCPSGVGFRLSFSFCCVLGRHDGTQAWGRGGGSGEDHAV